MAMARQHCVIYRVLTVNQQNHWLPAKSYRSTAMINVITVNHNVTPWAKNVAVIIGTWSTLLGRHFVLKNASQLTCWATTAYIDGPVSIKCRARYSGAGAVQAEMLTPGYDI